MPFNLIDFNANFVVYFECFYFLVFQEVDDQSILTEAWNMIVWCCCCCLVATRRRTTRRATLLPVVIYIYPWLLHYYFLLLACWHTTTQPEPCICAAAKLCISAAICAPEPCICASEDMHHVFVMLFVLLNLVFAFLILCFLAVLLYIHIDG